MVDDEMAGRVLYNADLHTQIGMQKGESVVPAAADFEAPFLS